MNDLHVVYLALGTNLGNKEENLHRAVKNINKKIGKVISLSSFYNTEPVGFESSNSFLNAACKVKTSLNPLQLLNITTTIEKEMGRTGKSTDTGYKDRIIDIDILLYDNLIINTPNLTLPHPQLHIRKFVINPLQEIAKSVIHPVLKINIAEIKKRLDNDLF